MREIKKILFISVNFFWLCSLAVRPIFAQVYEYVDQCVYRNYQLVSGSCLDSAINNYNDGGWDNYGLHGSWQIYSFLREHFLLRFDVSSIPKNATCIDATLQLTLDDAPRSGSTATITVYSISAANTAWIEGTKNIDPAGDGENSWNALASTGSNTIKIPWAGSAGLSTPGVDYEIPELGHQNFDTGIAQGSYISIPLTPSRIQGWFGSPNSNHGLLLVGTNGNGRHVGTSDHAIYNPTYVPKLTVHYTLTSPPPTIITPSSTPTPTATATPTPLPYDYDGDRDIDFIDLKLLLLRPFTIFDVSRLLRSL